MEFGKSLREAREAKGYTVTQIAETTHMLVSIVEGLEKEDFSRIAAPIYGRGFVKLYCEAVGLDAKPFVDEFMEIMNGNRDVSIKERPVAEPAPVQNVVPPPPRRRQLRSGISSRRNLKRTSPRLRPNLRLRQRPGRTSRGMLLLSGARRRSLRHFRSCRGASFSSPSQVSRSSRSSSAGFVRFTARHPRSRPPKLRRP